MKRERVYRTANLGVAGSIAGLLAAYPFSHTGIGGLLFAGFSAAAVGGLADSFAVSALFKDPLGIKWPSWMGTRIVQRNRDRLVEELSRMVQTDLLSVDAIRTKLETFRLTDWLLAYLDEQVGAETLASGLRRIGGDMIGLSDPEELADHVRSFALDQARLLRFAPLTADALEWSVRNGYADKGIAFALRELSAWVESEPFRALLEEVIGKMLDSYTAGSSSRKWFRSVAGLEPEQLAAKAQVWLARLAADMEAADHPYRRKLSEWVQEWIGRLRTDEELQISMQQAAENGLRSALDRLDLTSWIANLANRGEHPEKTAGWLVAAVRELLKATRGNRQWADSLHRNVTDRIVEGIASRHGVVGEWVREGLGTFSNEELVRFVQERAGKDLQYVRINGTVIGFAAGLLLYAATLWVGR